MPASNVPGLVFSENGLAVPDTDAVLAGVQEDWKSALGDDLNLADDTPQGQLIASETEVIADKDMQLLTLANMFNPETSHGIWQDALAKIYFLDRKQGAPTGVTCQITGRPGTTIPYGALVKSKTGHTLICNHAVTIGDTSTAETTFRVSENGPVIIPKDSVTEIVTVVPGWDTVNNAAPGATGRDVESRFEFEERRYASVAANAHGTVPSLHGYIANINGVIDLKVLENIGPNPKMEYGVSIPGHGVTICVFGGDDAAIADVIYRKKDAGCDTGGNTEITHTATETPGNPVYTYTILRPTAVSFWVRVTTGQGVRLTAEQQTAVKQAVFDDFHGISEVSGNDRVGLASTVYASRFYCPALHVDGVRDLAEIAIAFGNDAGALTYGDAVTINANQMPAMSLDTITIIQGA